MPNVKLNTLIENEISRLSELHNVDSSVLGEFAQFVLKNAAVKQSAKPAKTTKATKSPKKSKSSKSSDISDLSVADLRNAVYRYFEVSDTTKLKKSGSFKMATDGMGEIDFRLKETWEMLYRKFIGVLPGEESQEGYGCINGVDIFKYFKPWDVFGLNSKTASPEDVKQAYRNLSKTYHPDIPETGDAKIFDRINTMYKSISVEA